MKQTILRVGGRLAGWAKRRRRVLTIVGVGVVIVSIAVQLLYPPTMALPFTSVMGERTDFKNREDIVALIQERFTKTSLVVCAGDKTYQDELSVFGASINPDAMASKALSYPLVMRFIPLSGLWYHPKVERFALSFNDTQLAKTSALVTDTLTVGPKDASLTIDDGKLQIEAAANGRLVTTKMVQDAIKQSSFMAGKNTVTIEGERTKPRVSDAAIAAVKQQAETLLKRSVTIKVDDAKDFSPTREEVATWISIKTDDTQAVSMTLSSDKIAEYLAKINETVQIKPTATTVALRDGKEQSRQTGKPGRAIPLTNSAETIRDQLALPGSGSASIKIATAIVEPPVTYNRTYTSSQAGLSAYTQFITSTGDIKLSVRQLNGSEYAASGAGSDSIPSASTYKLYVMLRAFDDINQSKLKWDDLIVGDSFATCFDRMIVVSANNCSEQLIKQFGAQKLTDYLHGKGFSKGTGFTFSDATHSTADDLVKLFVGIEDGSLVSGQNRSMLLEKMGRQIYRNGIPAGSAGSVYDKVGFLWDYNHDAAIVRHPKGTYALAVMTKGHSFAKVAEITRELERIMYP